MLLCALSAAAAPAASAAPASTTNPTPASGAAGVQRLCGPDPAYSCDTGGYAGQSTGWWGAKYGAGQASSNVYGYHNCTLYAAYRIAQNGVGDPGWSANATDWDTSAYAHGTPVDQTPAVGAVAQWNRNFGHVAYVEAVTPSYIEVTDDNYSYNVTDRWRIAVGSAAWPDNFIHFHDLPSGPPADGSFVSHNGFVYRIAGGAPIYVSTWAAVGGPQPSMPLSDAQFAALPQYPRDGTILDASSGRVFVTAGGAATYVSSWSAIGGPQPGIGVDEAAIDNAGGGVPWDHLRAYPADGTLINTNAEGRVYVIAGGAPTYLSNWNAIGGAKPSTTIDQWAIDHPDDPHAHLRAYPADGTLINTNAEGRVYVIAGGAPTYLSNWNAIGGAKPSTTIDQWAIDHPDDPHAHLRAYPADGTFLSTIVGRVYRVAGGAPFAVSSWALFGGLQPNALVDQWAIDHRDDPHAHLRPAPADGTLVEGVPSDRYWAFNGGLRSPAAGASNAIPVDDIGLGAFPIRPTSGVSMPPSPGAVHGPVPSRHLLGCVVPRLIGATLRQARLRLRHAHCRLGKVSRPHHVRHGLRLRIVSQSAHPGAKHRQGFRVRLRLAPVRS